MLYLTSKFHDNRVNTFGSMEGRGGGLLKPTPLGPGTPKKPRRNRVNMRPSSPFKNGESATKQARLVLLF